MGTLLRCSSLISEGFSRKSIFGPFSRNLYSSAVCSHKGLSDLCGSSSVFKPRLNTTFKWKTPAVTSNFASKRYSEDSTVKLSDQSNEQKENIHETDNDSSRTSKTADSENPQFSFAAHAKSDVIQRLRRLSMTDVDEYEPSEAAHKTAREMAEVRSKVNQRGEQWRWDQRYMRPGGFPTNPNMRNNRNMPTRNWDNDMDEEDNYDDNRRSSPGRSGGYQMDNRRGFTRSPRRDEDEEAREDYEEEMERLRNKMQSVKTKRLEMEQERATRNKEATATKEQDESSESIKLSSFQHTPDSESGDSSASPNQHNISSPYTSILDQPAPNDIHTIYSDAHSKPEDDFNMNFASDDPDTFGNLMTGPVIVKDTITQQIQKELQEEAKAVSIMAEEEEEEEDDVRVRPPKGEGWTTQKLTSQVRQLLAEKKLKEAVDLYTKTLDEGGFRFYKMELTHHYNVLINECADAGYVEMAFHLYGQMKNTGHREKPRTITSLFNAIANSAWDKENNLDRIERLLIGIKERNIYPNIITYTALIKAYGRLGEIVLAFGVVDKMIQESNIQPDLIVFNMLLQACVTDKKNGFRHALITWKKMQLMGIRPDIYSYNLLLKVTNYCGVDFDVTKISQGQNISNLTYPMLPPIISEDDRNSLLQVIALENPSNQMDENSVQVENFEEPITMDLKTIKRALQLSENRMALLGGVRGIVSQMVQNKVGPNLKTLTSLMNVAKHEDVSDVLRLLKTYKIKGDEKFYAVAIKKCYELNRPILANDIIKLMHMDNVVPNISVYSAMSFGCSTIDEAKDFLKNMDESNFHVNIQIMANLQRSAMVQYDPMFMLYIMEEVRKREIDVDKAFLHMLEEFYKLCQRGLVSQEMGKSIPRKKLEFAIENNRKFAEYFRIFKMRYPRWLESVNVKIDPDNPWKEEFEHFKQNKSHKSIETETSVIDLESLSIESKIP